MAMRVKGPGERGQGSNRKYVSMPEMEEISPEFAAAMREMLGELRMTRRWSYYVLSCDISDVSGVAINEEALRRWLLGTQQLQQRKLCAIRTYLERNNPETEHRARLTARALAAAEGLHEGHDERALPSMQEIAGLFAADYLADRIELAFTPVGRNAALVIERLYAGERIQIATGHATLDAHGTLKLVMQSPRGYTYYYDHFGTVRAGGDGPIETLAMGRTGMPLDLSGDAASDHEEIISHIAENMLWFHRVPGGDGSAEAARVPPNCAQGEARARETAPASSS